MYRLKETSATTATVRTGVERGMFKIFCYLSYEAVITYRRLYIVGGRVNSVTGGVGRVTDGTDRVIVTGGMMDGTGSVIGGVGSVTDGTDRVIGTGRMTEGSSCDWWD